VNTVRISSGRNRLILLIRRDHRNAGGSVGDRPGRRDLCRLRVEESSFWERHHVGGRERRVEPWNAGA